MSVKAFDFSSLREADLIVDAIYEGGRSGNAGDDPLPRLLGLMNQGGFRYLGNQNAPQMIVLTTSFADPDWPDSFDVETGVFTYFGDNKRPGSLIHQTRRHGNELLRDMFNAMRSHPPLRGTVPPIFLFRKAGVFRDMVFLGLAVPGVHGTRAADELVAIWKSSGGQRFQNYRAFFTVLDVAHLSRKWLIDVQSGNPLSGNCPDVWRNWVEEGRYAPLTTEPSVEFRTKREQLPSSPSEVARVREIHSYFKVNPFAFENCAASIVRMMDRNFVSFDMTRPTRDGGRDAVGHYRIGQGSSAILVDFSLEAKCYDLNNSVGVREVSRLISRLRHRQFGVLITTSYVNLQAYKEIKEDAHPIVILAARDIVNVLSQAGINTTKDVERWLATSFPITNI